jgi:hypothetical protein
MAKNSTTPTTGKIATMPFVDNAAKEEEPKCMYRLLFASVQLHVFWKSLICIRPVIGLFVCRGPVGSTHAPLSH